MRPVLATVALLAALTGGAAARASAQAATITSAIQASVEIAFPPLSGVGLRSLDFGVLVPGVASPPVLPATTQSAEFRVTGTMGHKSIDIVWLLPPALVGPGAATIPLSFNGNYAAACEIDVTGACIAASYVVWNPVTTPTFHDTPQRYSPGRKVYTYNDFSVYMGGVATPAPTQRAGYYTASIGLLMVLN